MSYENYEDYEEELAAALEMGAVAPCAGCGELFHANDLVPVDPFADDTMWLCPECCDGGYAPIHDERDVVLGPVGREALGAP